MLKTFRPLNLKSDIANKKATLLRSCELRKGTRDSHNSYREFCRHISTPRLHALLHFHLAPINVVIFHESQRFLILESASRLDAFSGYPIPT